MLKLSKNNITEKLILFTFFLALFLPLHSTNLILSYIQVLGKINILHILILLCFMLIIKPVIIRMNKIDLLVLSYLALDFIMLFVGLLKGYATALSDCSYFLFPALFYFLFKFIFIQGYDIYKFLDISYYALTGNCLFNIFIITTRLPVFGYTTLGGTKWGGGFYSCLVITISYGVFLLYHNINRIPRCIIIAETIIGIILVVLANSRTLLMMVIVPIVMVPFLTFNNVNTHRLRNNRVFFFIVILLMFFSVLFLIISGSSPVAERMRNISILGRDDTFMTRIYSFIYSIRDFFKAPWGTGMGASLSFYNSNGRFVEYVPFLDNFFINAAIKGGILFLSILIFMIYKTYKSLKEKKRETKDSLYTLLLFSFTCFLIQTTLMSSQALHNYAASICLWACISAYINMTDNNNMERKHLEYCIKKN